MTRRPTVPRVRPPDVAWAVAGVWLAISFRPLQAEEPCLPRTPASVRRVAEDLGLDEGQVRALVAAFRGGPDEGWHAAGEPLPVIPLELREAVEAALCGEAFARGQVLAGATRRGEGGERRLAFHLETPAVEARFRARARDDAEGLLLRGGAIARRSRMALSAGTLKVRHGLGLVLETAGAEARGDAPRDAARGDANLTLSTDPAVARGVAFGAVARTWRAEILGFQAAGAREAGATGAGRVAWDLSGLRWTLAGASVPGSMAWGLGMGGRVPAAGTWSVEAATGGGSLAMAAAAGGGWGRWRFRGSLGWKDSGYRSPGVRGWEAPRGEEVLLTVIEGRRLVTAGRGVRFLWSEDRGPDRDGSPRRRLTVEGEVAERLARGLQLTFLWRSRRTEAPAGVAHPDRVQEARGELRFVRRGLSARIRVDDRVDAPGDRSLRMHVGWDRGDWAWEIRALRVEGAPGSLRTYFRRAGDASGWTTAPSGTTVGAWLRRRIGNLALEASVDGGAGPWIWAVAVEQGFGGRLDPRRAGP